MNADLSSRDAILAAARDLYSEAPAVPRTLQSLRPYICPFEDLLPFVPEEGRILDIGCGAGLFLGLVGRARTQVSGIGFDASRDAIAVAQSMAQRHFAAGRIDFRYSAVEDPWPSELFNVVSMIDVLHHVAPAHQAAAIRTAYDHVAPGGVIIYKDMADRPPLHAAWNRLHDMIIARQWIHYRPIDEVRGWLEAAGARVVRQAARSLGPYAHELVVVEKPA